MPGFALSAEQHRYLRALLRRCDEMSNTADLRALFTDERLRPWRDGVPETDSLRSRVDRLIDYLGDKRNTNSQSALTLLLWVLAERYEPDDERHHNLLALASELTYGFRAILPPNSPTDPQLERMIRASNTMLDIQRWIARLNELKDQVCRISVSQGANITCGTGFLVAPDVALTNYHVVQAVIAGQAKPGDVKLLFDYHLKEDGVTPCVGKSYTLAQDWLIDASPYSPLDLQSDPGGDPDPEQLDYALLRLDGAPGREQISRPVGGAIAALPRGYIPLPSPQAAPVACIPNSPILIIQHPHGKELKLAIDTDAVIGMNGNGTRLRYRTNTEAGSSGSPCFDANWTLVALHHSGDPNHSQFCHPQYNQGIPIAAIVRLLEQRGKLALLTAH